MRWLVLVGVLGCRGGGAAATDATPTDGVQLLPLSPDEATRACVVFGSCMGDGINDCFTDAMPFWTLGEARCLIAAGGDCSAARACFGQTVVADASCVPGIACDGDTLVQCADGVRATVSCPTASRLLGVGTGSTCVITATGALCGDATCSADAAACTGDVITACIGSKGVSISFDCAPYSQSCVDGRCTAAGGGATCAAGTLASCRGDSIVQCDRGVETTRACTSISSTATCVPGDVANPEPYCGFNNLCYPTKGDETCSGTSVNICAAGEPATIDCTTLGFSTCAGGSCF